MAGNRQSRSWIRRRWWVIPAAAVLIMAAAFFAYTSDYYRAEEKALQALDSDETVRVSEVREGWLFDGPAEDTAIIFYPGAKVEETAYAPLLHELAAQDMDAFLVKVPFRIAFFGKGKAGDVMALHEYDKWYAGGHSLGGVVAAEIAADNPEKLEGLILLASYPTKKIDDGLTEILIVGSEDGVVNRERLEEAEKFAPERFIKAQIDGGNHAGFGMYGPQKGDGAAAISADQQIKETVKLIKENR